MSDQIVFEICDNNEINVSGKMFMTDATIYFTSLIDAYNSFAKDVKPSMRWSCILTNNDYLNIVAQWNTLNDLKENLINYYK